MLFIYVREYSVSVQLMGFHMNEKKKEMKEKEDGSLSPTHTIKGLGKEY